MATTGRLVREARQWHVRSGPAAERCEMQSREDISLAARGDVWRDSLGHDARRDATRLVELLIGAKQRDNNTPV